MNSADSAPDRSPRAHFLRRGLVFTLATLASVLVMAGSLLPFVRNAVVNPPTQSQTATLTFELRGFLTILNPPTDVEIVRSGSNIDVRILVWGLLNPPDPQSFYPWQVSLGNLPPGEYQVTARITDAPGLQSEQFFSGSLSVSGTGSALSFPATSFSGLLVLILGVLVVVRGARNASD